MNTHFLVAQGPRPVRKKGEIDQARSNHQHNNTDHTREARSAGHRKLGVEMSADAVDIDSCTRFFTIAENAACTNVHACNV